MKRYEVHGGAISLHSGVVDLTRSQAEPRLGNLEGHELSRVHAKSSAKSDLRARYVLIGEVQFKVGEVIGYDGELPKVIADRLFDLDALASAVEAEKLRTAEREAAKIADAQRQELVAAMAGINGNSDGTIDGNELRKLLTGRVNFDPTFE